MKENVKENLNGILKDIYDALIFKESDAVQILNNDLKGKIEDSCDDYISWRISHLAGLYKNWTENDKEKSELDALLREIFEKNYWHHTKDLIRIIVRKYANNDYFGLGEYINRNILETLLDIL